MLSFWSRVLFSQEPLRRSHLKLTFLGLVLMLYCAVLGLYAASLAAALLVHQFTRYLRSVPLDVDATFNLLAGEYTVAAVNT